MSEPEFTIPDKDLPRGFAEAVGRPRGKAAPTRPAATVVLARDGDPGLEVLLMRRNRNAGFVPGAYVFPGGRVDREDADPELLARIRGLTPEHAADRLGSETGDFPPIAFYLAAVREAFEETGLLLATTSAGAPVPSGADDEQVEQDRRAVLENRIEFGELLTRRGWWIAGDRMEYISHWITPIAEPRRYDTRFFLAAVPADSRAVLDEREMIDEQWLTPAVALDRHDQGELPMVFPTIKTLQALAEHSSVADAMDYFADRPIPSILPRLVRTPTGVGIELPESG